MEYYIEREIILGYITWHVMLEGNVIVSYNNYYEAVDFILFMENI